MKPLPAFAEMVGRHTAAVGRIYVHRPSLCAGNGQYIDGGILNLLNPLQPAAALYTLALPQGTIIRVVSARPGLSVTGGTAALLMIFQIAASTESVIVYLADLGRNHQTVGPSQL